MPPRRIGSAASITASILFAGLPISTAYSQVQIAEDLLISLDATNFTTGSSWVNSGSIDGDFVPSNSPVRLDNVSGASAVFLDGVDYFIGPNTIPALDETDASYSIEVWAYNGYLNPEESMVTWASRGNAGENVSFNYGNHSGFGAMGHWGDWDMGWGPVDNNDNSSTPPVGLWHHLVYTYDGLGTQRVYVNGTNTNTEGGVFLNPKDNLPIQIGAQREADGLIATANTFSGLLSKVRVHAGTLSDDQILNNYNFEKTQFQPQTQQLERGPVNRYTFDDLESAADGTIVPDVVGGKDAVIRGGGATAVTLGEAEGVQLPGGDQNQAYIDLPNGIASGTADGGEGYQSASYEAWVTVLSNSHWARIMDFGSSNNGEVFDPGGAGSGTNYIFLSATANSDNNVVLNRGGDANAGGPAVGPGERMTPGMNMLGTEMHVVMSYDSAAQEWRWFQNGILMQGFSSIGGPTTIDDVNNWLGRSNWGQDSNLNGIFNEFRVYDYALNQEQVAGNFALGPDFVNVPEPGSALLLGIGATLLSARRRRKS